MRIRDRYRMPAASANRLKKLALFHFGRSVRFAMRAARLRTTATYVPAADRDTAGTKHEGNRGVFGSPIRPLGKGHNVTLAANERVRFGFIIDGRVDAKELSRVVVSLESSIGGAFDVEFTKVPIR